MITLKCYELLRNILFLLTKQKYATTKKVRRENFLQKKKKSQSGMKEAVTVL